MDQMISLLLVKKSYFPLGWWYVTIKKEIRHIKEKDEDIAGIHHFGVCIQDRPTLENPGEADKTTLLINAKGRMSLRKKPLWLGLIVTVILLLYQLGTMLEGY